MGTANRGRHSNPKVDMPIDQALATMDDGAGEKIIRQAMNAVLVIMLHLQKNIWAVRKGLTYEPGWTRKPRAMSVHPR